MRRQPGAPFFCFYKERLGTKSPPHPPQCAHWGTFPPRGRLWGVEAQRVGNRLSPKCFSAYFFRKNAFQIGLSIPDVTAPLSYQRQRPPKRANESERAMNPGVQGRSPGPLSPHFSGEMGTPAGQAGPPGRCAPRPRKSLDHPKGTQYRTAPPPGAGRATGRCAPRWLPRHYSEGTQHRAAPDRWSGFRPAQGPAGMAGRNLSRKCPRRPPRWEGRLGQ